jgi:predicted ATPase
LERAFARARQLCQELHDPPELFPVLWALTLFHLIRGNLRECRDRADELIVKAGRSGNPAFVMAAHHIAGVAREFIGDIVESSRLLERARDLHVPAEHPVYTAMYGLDPGMLARAMSSRPLWALGYPDRADERARETLAIARSQRQPMTLAFALVVMQGIHLYRGEAAEALTMGDEIIAVCREYEQPQETEWSRSFQGSALAVLGRTGEGIDLLKDSLRVQQSIGAGLVRPAFLAMLADALRQEGRVEEGLEAVAEGLAHAERTFEGGYVAELHRMRGELLRLAGNEAGAEESLRAALDYARGQQAKSLELRAATSLARLQAASGLAVDARAELASVYDWFTEGLETMDLVAARRLLSETE